MREKTKRSDGMKEAMILEKKGFEVSKGKEKQSDS